MKYLIDTHTFLWFNAGAKELSDTAKLLIQDKNNEIFVSIVSLWEISIKNALSKLHIEGSYGLIIEDITENDMKILPMNFAHTAMQNKLIFHLKTHLIECLFPKLLLKIWTLLARILFLITISSKRISR